MKLLGARTKGKFCLEFDVGAACSRANYVFMYLCMYVYVCKLYEDIVHTARKVNKLEL